MTSSSKMTSTGRDTQPSSTSTSMPLVGVEAGLADRDLSGRFLEELQGVFRPHASFLWLDVGEMAARIGRP